MKKLIAALLVFLSGTASQASYCYTYGYTHDLYVKDGRLWMHSVAKEGVSYIDDTIVEIGTDIDLSGFEFIGPIVGGYVCATNSAYYLVHYNGKDKQYKVQLLYKKSVVSELVDACFFKVGGVWLYVYSDYYEALVVKKAMPELPATFSIVRSFHNGYNPHFLLSDGKSLYTVNKDLATTIKTKITNDGFEIVGQNEWTERLLVKTAAGYYQYNPSAAQKLTKIPHLTVAKTKIYLQHGAYDMNYLYDDDTFYELDQYYSFKDLSLEFQACGKNDGFLASQFVGNGSDLSFYDADSTLWVPANVSLRDGPTVTFFPLTGARLAVGERSYFLYKGKVFSSAWDAVYDRDSIDGNHSELWLNSLKPIDDYYTTDGQKVYRAGNLRELDWLSPSTKRVFQTVGAYIYRDGNNLIRDTRSDMMRPDTIMQIDGPQREVGPALVDKNNVFIDYRIVKNTADVSSMKFIGSTVRIVRACDDRGTPPSKIDRFYFFSTNDGVYYYYSGLNELKKIHAAGDPLQYRSDNFEDMKRLEAMANQPPIEYNWRIDQGEFY